MCVEKNSEKKLRNKIQKQNSKKKFRKKIQKENSERKFRKKIQKKNLGKIFKTPRPKCKYNSNLKEKSPTRPPYQGRRCIFKINYGSPRNKQPATPHL